MLLRGSVTVKHLAKSLAAVLAGLALAMVLAVPEPAAAQAADKPVGKIEWGLWIDDDGCMHWWADGGTEGYMVPRRNPKTGKPVCLKKSTCLVEPADTLFDADSARLTAESTARLARFFRKAQAFGYAIHGHTDSRASEAKNQRLSQRRAEAVGDVARAVGAPVQTEIGFGGRHPVASNQTAAGMAQNRRVEIVCYRW